MGKLTTIGEIILGRSVISAASPEERAEFLDLITAQNLARMRVVAVAVLIFFVLMTVLNLSHPAAMHVKLDPGFLGKLIRLRLVWMAVLVLFLLVSRKPSGRVTLRHHLSDQLFLLAALGMAAYQAAMIQPILPIISSFLLACFTGAALVVMDLRRAVLTYGFGLLTFLVMVQQYQPSWNITVAHLVNSGLMCILCVLATQIIYRKEASQFRDNKVIEQQRDELHRLSFTDSLTGIPNRRGLDLALAREWPRAIRQGAPVAAIMADIDHFKPYNDSLGHQAGDQCLRQVAEVLRGCVARPADLVARYGGEEFAILLPDVDMEGAALVGEKMRRAVEELGIPHPGAPDGVLTISLGVAVRRPAVGQPFESLLADADRALYRAKNAGRNRCFRNTPPA